jgi:hypothetical protein
VRLQLQLIEQSCYGYDPFGPNSSTALHQALDTCGLPTALPEGVNNAPGWRNFEPNDKQCWK